MLILSLKNKVVRFYLLLWHHVIVCKALIGQHFYMGRVTCFFCMLLNVFDHIFCIFMWMEIFFNESRLSHPRTLFMVTFTPMRMLES